MTNKDREKFDADIERLEDALMGATESLLVVIGDLLKNQEEDFNRINTLEEMVNALIDKELP